MPDGLGHALLQACSRFNHATALQAPGSAVTYRALAGQAQAAAKGLRAAGLRADEPVLVMVSNQPGDIAALLAVWLAGGVVVAVHRSTPPALLAGLQQRTGARLGLDWTDASAPPALQTLAEGPPPHRPLLAGERITQVGLVPTMMRMVLTDPSLDPAIAQVVQQSHLRQMLIGGELLGLSLAETLRRRFSATQLIDIYGLTETSTCDFFAFPADAARRPGCIGRPSPQVQHRIADAAGQPVAAGAVGELQLRSPFLLAGYLDAPELTAAAFQHGWFRTGDLARQHADGLVELMGRQKELISRGGHKLTPVEVEQALSAHPDVAAAMVTGVADAVLGERIHVLVVSRSGTAPTVAALRQHLAGRLEKFKHPDAWHVAAALPLGRTGKADRGALGALIAAGQTVPLPP